MQDIGTQLSGVSVHDVKLFRVEMQGGKRIVWRGRVLAGFGDGIGKFGGMGGGHHHHIGVVTGVMVLCCRHRHGCVRVNDEMMIFVNVVDGGEGLVITHGGCREGLCHACPCVFGNGGFAVLLQLSHEIGHIMMIASRTFIKQAFKIAGGLNIHAGTQRRTHGVRLHDSTAEKARQDIIMIGGNKAMVNGHSHAFCGISGEHIAKIAAWHDKGDAFASAMRPQLGNGMTIIDHLCHDARPIDGVHGSQWRQG